MPIRSSDALVVGGGVNGLACAIALARAGARVTVLEAGDRPGGAAAVRDFHPGYSAAIAHLAPPPDPRLAAALPDLPRGGPLATTVLSEAGPVTVSGRTASTDAAAWAALHGRLSAHARLLEPFRRMTPPRLARGGGAETWALARRALSLRLAGKAQLRDLLRLVLTNAADVATDELADPRLQALLGFDATLGAWAGPRSPGTLLLYLDRLAQGAPALPRANWAEALAAAATSAGVTLRTRTRVARILTRDHRACGVMLEDGTELAAERVVSALSPGTTFRQLLGPRPIDTGLFRRAAKIRARGAAAKLHLALTGLPDFGCDPATRMVFAENIDQVETAWNPVKYHEVPDRPVIEAVIPSLADPSLAPAGGHVLSAVVQFAPHAPPEPEAARARLLETALAVLTRHAPGLRGMIAHAELLMPSEIALTTGLDNGAWHGADLAADAMFFLRPLPELAQYATPLPGLWLAGAGCHPGGGLSGTAGWNAAERILKEAA